MPSFRQTAPPLEVKPKRKKASTAFTQFDLEKAKWLKRLLSPPTWSSSKWADDVRLLRISLPQGAEHRIESAIQWLFNTDNASGHPIRTSIQSAGSFRRHFNWLEEIIAKAEGDYVEDISPEAKSLAKELRRMSWPQGSDELLEQSIQLTLDRYTKTLQIVLTMYQSRKRTHEQLPSPKRTDRYLLLLEHLYRSRLSSPEHFARRWLEDIHRQVANWSGWNGDLIGMAFKFDAPRFQRMLRGWSDEFGSETETWHTFWKDFCDANGET